MQTLFNFITKLRKGWSTVTYSYVIYCTSLNNINDNSKIHTTRRHSVVIVDNQPSFFSTKSFLLVPIESHQIPIFSCSCRIPINPSIDRRIHFSCWRWRRHRDPPWRTTPTALSGCWPLLFGNKSRALGRAGKLCNKSLPPQSCPTIAPSHAVMVTDGGGGACVGNLLQRRVRRSSTVPHHVGFTGVPAVVNDVRNGWPLGSLIHRSSCRGAALQNSISTSSLFGWLVANGWCWFVLREEYCWLVAGGWFVVREKYCWLVAYKQFGWCIILSRPLVGLPVQFDWEQPSLLLVLAEVHLCTKKWRVIFFNISLMWFFCCIVLLICLLNLLIINIYNPFAIHC
jgi:hypothetical protein